MSHYLTGTLEEAFKTSSKENKGSERVIWANLGFSSASEMGCLEMLTWQMKGQLPNLWNHLSVSRSVSARDQPGGQNQLQHLEHFHTESWLHSNEIIGNTNRSGWWSSLRICNREKPRSDRWCDFCGHLVEANTAVGFLGGTWSHSGDAEKPPEAEGGQGSTLVSLFLIPCKCLPLAGPRQT